MTAQTFPTPRARGSKRVLPGFTLSLGFTVAYLSVLVRTPLSALVLNTISLARN